MSQFMVYCTLVGILGSDKSCIQTTKKKKTLYVVLWFFKTLSLEVFYLQGLENFIFSYLVVLFLFLYGIIIISKNITDA